MSRRIISTLSIVLVLGASLALVACGGGKSNKLEIFSWWTVGGEGEGLKALFDIYHKQYPNVQIINAAVAGGAGTNAKALLATRLTGGKPPDAFQLHAGLEVEKYDPEKYILPLDDFYKSEGLDKVLPQDLLSLLQYKGHYWGVPVDIHRANILWYNKKVFADAKLQPPTTWDEYFKVVKALKARKIIPLAFGSKDGYEAGHTFETVLISVLGPDAYKGLWTGATKWTDPKVADALNTLKKLLADVNSDHSALTWDGALGQYFITNKAGMMIMGDWVNGWFISQNFTDYGWECVPGPKVFDGLSDSFALPKGAPDNTNAMNWLKVCASQAGQGAFNPLKGSIPARTDVDPSLFNPYSQSAMKDWTSEPIVPSVVHGAAATEKWATVYKDILATFATSGDVAAAQKALDQTATDNLAK
jgi:glucose/mannose transport system substrate-binding protein